MPGGAVLRKVMRVFSLDMVWGALCVAVVILLFSILSLSSPVGIWIAFFIMTPMAAYHVWNVFSDFRRLFNDLRRPGSPPGRAGSEPG